MILLEELIEDYRRQAEEYGGEDDPRTFTEGRQGRAFPATTGEGISTRVFEDNAPYYPSADKGDVMATGEELVALFGITYEDERN